MPPIETADLHQRAVYWEKVGDSRYGEPLRESAKQLNVRWKWAKGNSGPNDAAPVSWDATVVVACPVVVGSIFWYGCLADFWRLDEAADDLELFEAVDVRVTPDLKNRNVRTTAVLKRFKGTLPGTAY